MPASSYRSDKKSVILECKDCGFRMPYLKDNLKIFRPVCRLCHGTRWRRCD